MSVSSYHDSPEGGGGGATRGGGFRGSSSGVSAASGGFSGTSYDRWAYEQATKQGAGANDSALNKLQHKYWVTKQKVVRKLGKEEDEHMVASDAELDAKLEMYSSIQSTTVNLQRIIEVYQDRLCNLAYEENCLGRFLKDYGKLDKTKAGKMMVAVGKAMSYNSTQRLTIRQPLVRLQEEVETFGLRAIEDTQITVSSMEKVRTEYRGALMWMKNVSTELDPDTYKQLEKFRKVQAHVKSSKVKFDKLKVDCLQKIDLLAAARCNMFSHALSWYQNALISFWEKTAKTMNHVEQSFKGYQHYEFTYIKELAEPSKLLTELEASQKKAARKVKKKEAAAAAGDANKEQEESDKKEELERVKDEKYFFDPEYTDEPPEQAVDALEMSKQAEDSLNNLLDLGNDEDDDILLQLDTDKHKGATHPLLSLDDQGQEQEQKQQQQQQQTTENWLGQMGANDAKLLEDLIGDTSPSKDGGTNNSFTAQWNTLFGGNATKSDTVPSQGATGLLEEDEDDFSSFISARSTGSSDNPNRKDQQAKSLLPSELFDLDQSLFSQQSPRSGPHDLLSDFPMPSPARPSSVQMQIAKMQEEKSDDYDDLLGSLSSMPESAGQQQQGGAKPKNSRKKETGSESSSKKDMSQWFSLFADIDPLANPDAIGKSTKESDPNCYS